MKNLSIYKAKSLAQRFSQQGYTAIYLKHSGDGLPWWQGYSVQIIGYQCPASL